MAPATIILMRHAEKPQDKSDPHLSATGRARAARLAATLPRLAATQPRLSRAPPVLFAASDKPGSVRPRETLEPLAAAAGLTIREFPDKRSEAFAETLLRDPQFEGQLVVVSWRHDALPVLARALGAPEGLCPDPWPSELYDLVLRFDYEPGAEVRVSAVTEL